MFPIKLSSAKFAVLLLGLLTVHGFSQEIQPSKNHFRVGLGFGLADGLMGVNVGYNLGDFYFSVNKSAFRTLAGIDLAANLHDFSTASTQLMAHVSAGAGFHLEGVYYGGGVYFKTRPSKKSNFSFNYGLDVGYLYVGYLLLKDIELEQGSFLTPALTVIYDF